MPLTEIEFAEQLKIRDMVSNLCAEIDAMNSFKEKQEVIDYAIAQLTDLKAEGL